MKNFNTHSREILGAAGLGVSFIGVILTGCSTASDEKTVPSTATSAETSVRECHGVITEAVKLDVGREYAVKGMIVARPTDECAPLYDSASDPQRQIGAISLGDTFVATCTTHVEVGSRAGSGVLVQVRLLESDQTGCIVAPTDMYQQMIGDGMPVCGPPRPEV